MPSADRLLAATVLGLAGLAVAAGNAWVAAARSTIPIALAGRVVAVQRLPEKHSGIDDVRLVELDDGTERQVDEVVFREVGPGSVLAKEAGARTLAVDGRSVALEWSEDARGMAVVMPLALVLLASVLVYGARVPMRRP